MQIDWWTVAAQIVNFLALVWLLQRFLYRPIIAAMARREALIASRIDEAKAARAEVEADSAQLREARQALADSREGLLREAREDAAALRARLEAELHAEMAARRKAWEVHLAEDRDDFTARLRQRAGHQVIEIVGRILGDYAGADLAEQMAGTFADRLADLPPEKVEKLTAAAGRVSGAARIDSSAALTPTARARITRAIHARIGPQIGVDYHEDADLLLGIRLTLGEQTVEWSAARFLARLETTLDETIRAEGGTGRAAPPSPGRGVA